MSENYNYQNGNNYQNEEPQKKKKNGSNAKKIFGTIGLACVFGITASVFFNLSNAINDRFLNKNKQSSNAFVAEEKTEDTGAEVAKDEKEEKEEKEAEAKKIEGTISNSIADFSDETFAMHHNSDGRYTVTEVAKETMPSIVAITNKSIQELRSMYGMEIRQFESESAGSGIIIGQNDTELLIVTNAHVISDANTLTVKCIDDEVYEAKVKGSDDVNDIAVIAVNLSDISGSTLDAIKVATIGSSKDLEIGEQVVAIGNAMGYGQSVTTGIVSALDRTIDGDENGTCYIQTDAAINPGNSGGALLNMDGELVGINSAKLANTKIEGMGYAIPIDAAETIVEDLMTLVSREKVDEEEAGYLGITGFSVTDEVAAAYGIPKGIYISEVTKDSAAEKAGIQKGDVIVSFEGIGMDSINKLRERLDYYKAGESVRLVISRADDGNYVEKEISAVLDNREDTLKSYGSSKDEKNDNQNNDSNNGDGQSQDDNQKSGEFNIGGSTFKYSVPNNIFDIFGR